MLSFVTDWGSNEIYLIKYLDNLWSHDSSCVCWCRSSGHTFQIRAQVNPVSCIIGRLHYSTLFQSLEQMPAVVEAEHQQNTLQSVHDSSVVKFVSAMLKSETNFSAVAATSCIRPGWKNRISADQQVQLSHSLIALVCTSHACFIGHSWDNVKVYRPVQITSCYLTLPAHSQRNYQSLSYCWALNKGLKVCTPRYLPKLAIGLNWFWKLSFDSI